MASGILDYFVGLCIRRVALFLTLFFTLLLNPAGASKFWTS
jgi:hypothetical protein